MKVPRSILVAAVLIDTLAVGVAFSLFYVLRFELGLLATPRLVPVALMRPLAVTAAFWLVLFGIAGFYRSSALRRWTRPLAIRLAKTVGIGLFVLFFLLFFDDVQAGAARLTLPVYAGLVWGFTAGGRKMLERLVPGLHRHGVALVPVAVVGDHARATYVADALERHPELGFTPTLLVTLGTDGDGRLYVMKREAQLPGALVRTLDATPDALEVAVAEAVAAYGVQEVVAVLGPTDQRLYFALAHAAARLAVPLRFVSNFRPILGTSSPDDPLASLALPPALT
ncbi:MAG TPA: hypothetical protein VD948_11820 [Rhodothermales bacterium]|nr:hypothetical protein [Rhodothermales bacterium]